MKIGELANQTGVTTQTLRFYEREGLLPEPARTSNGYRDYQKEMVGEIVFIRASLDAGFTLKEIKHLNGLDPNRFGTCAEMSDLLKQKLRDINVKIIALKRVRERLEMLEEQCSQHPPVNPCPALTELRP
jgi:MerR family mercuric resistance operon transcriptional regulator